MEKVYIRSKAGLINLGRQGENLATQVIYSGCPEQGQTVQVFVKRNGDSLAYPATNVTVDESTKTIVWTITSVDTDKRGTGQVQFKFIDSNTGRVIKTDVFTFIVNMSIDMSEGQAPDAYQTWVESLTEIAADAARSAESAAEALENIQTATNEEVAQIVSIIGE